MTRTYFFSENVHFPDIDAGGGMYHGRYLDYLDKARQSILKEHNLLLGDMIRSGYALVVVEANLRYFKPVLMEDKLYIYSRIIHTTNKTITVEQLISNRPALEEELDKPLADFSNCLHLAIIKLVGVDLKTKRAAQFPEAMAFLFEIEKEYT